MAYYKPLVLADNTISEHKMKSGYSIALGELNHRLHVGIQRLPEFFELSASCFRAAILFFRRLT